MNRSQKIILGLAAVVLFAGLGLVVIGSRPPPERAFKGVVRDLLPKAAEIPGWTIDYQPIADTPEMKAKVGELLNYDDAVFAAYQRGAERISVYVAYWTPGKMAPRLVAGHTPDVCWINSGWSCEAWSSGVRMPDGSGDYLPMAEQRSMRLNGNREFVAFWHMVAGKPLSYGTRGNPPWYSFLQDAFERNLDQRPEQWFMRISGNVPIESWQTEKPVVKLWERLRPATVGISKF